MEATALPEFLFSSSRKTSCACLMEAEFEKFVKSTFFMFSFDADDEFLAAAFRRLEGRRPRRGTLPEISARA